LGKSSEEINVCPSCGGALESGSRYCPGCGVTISKSKTGMISSRGSIFIVAGFVVLFGLLYLADATKPEKAVAGAPREQKATMPDNMAQYREMIDRLPQDYDKLVAMGNKLMDEGSYHLAIEAYKKAIGINSGDADIITDLGACYHALGNGEEAIRLFEKAIEINPKHAIAHFNLGIAYRDLNDNENVRKYWGRLVELYPDQPIADTVKKYLNQLDNN